ncbi:hypothetical protein ABEW95_17405 [Bacillus subtilis]
MILKNVLIGSKYMAHKDVMPFLDYKATVELTEEEQYLFAEATFKLAVHPNFPNLKKRILTVIFTNSGDITLAFPPNQIGSQGNYAAFNYSIWNKCDSRQKLICILEEFVHHFWNESDEIETSKIVCEFFSDLDYNRETGHYIYL